MRRQALALDLAKCHHAHIRGLWLQSNTRVA